MQSPLDSNLQPMLAQLARELPAGDFLYEPKWDGFRCLAFVREGRVELRSRNGRSLGRYFPEVCEPLVKVAGGDCVLDGELVIIGKERFDFPALLARLHPGPARVARLREETPAVFIAFDALCIRGEDLRDRPFAERRRQLEAVLADAPAALRVTPATADLHEARGWLDRFQGAGIDGVMAKARDLRYQPGRRAMIKVKHLRTVDCVLAGLRLRAGRSDGAMLGSLLLGVYDDERLLRHVGVASTFTDKLRRELLDELAPLVTQLEGHPWQRGFNLSASPIGRLKGSAGRWDPGEMTLDWTPLRPVRVCEVAYDQLDDYRFRHPARFLRWRPDRDADSCELAQLDVAPPPIPSGANAC